jgi:hypothetical protein
MQRLKTPIAILDTGHKDLNTCYLHTIRLGYPYLTSSPRTCRIPYQQHIEYSLQPDSISSIVVKHVDREEGYLRACRRIPC